MKRIHSERSARLSSTMLSPLALVQYFRHELVKGRGGFHGRPVRETESDSITSQPPRLPLSDLNMLVRHLSKVIMIKTPMIVDTIVAKQTKTVIVEK